MREPATAPPLEVERLRVSYGSKVAVAGLSLAVEKGTVYALLGRNGAGKTSLVRCLLGHRRAAAGRALLFGEDVWRRRGRLLARVGVVPERPEAPPAMSAQRLGRFFSRLYPTWDRQAYRRRLERLRVPMGIPFSRLSKGQQGQVSLGLALASNPELLILDDPTLGLDAVARRTVYDELIDELASRGTTVFLTSHDLSGIDGLADRVGILRGGRLLVDESLERLKRRFRRIRVPATDAQPPWLLPMRPLTVSSGAWGIEALVSEYETPASAQHGAEGATIEALGLEEIFIALVEEPQEGAVA